MDELNLEILQRIGKFTKKLRKDVSKIPKSGVDITEIVDFVESSIFKEGFEPAFPCGVSVNDVAAHYTVYDEGYILKKGDLIKIDFGVSYDGFICDNAITIEIDDNQYEKLMMSNFEALNMALNSIKIGTTMGEIGKIIENVAKKNGFNTIHNLSGHQIRRNEVHCGLSVPNFSNNSTSCVEDDMELAIEPFFTLGEPRIKSSGWSNHLHLVSDKQVRDPIARKVLDCIKRNYPLLPFSKRWLLKDVISRLKPNSFFGFDKKTVNYAVKILKSNGILHEYEKLVSVDGSYISQFEDTVVFKDKKKIVITRID